MEIKEEWKDIIGYKNYMVSNKGRVKSLGNNKTRKEKILKQEITNKGYCRVLLSQNNKHKHYFVHRLVCTAFIPNPDNLLCVNHKDVNPSNNCANNLEWCSYQYNNNYDSHSQKLGIAHRKPVAQYNKNGELVGLYTSVKQTSELLNINKDCIIRCCKGKQKSAGGYIFKHIKKAG